MKKEVVFFFNQDLSGNTYINHIKGALKELEYINPHFYYYHPREKKYYKSKINPFIRWIPPYVASHIIKYKYLDKLPKHIDGLFFFTFELPTGFIKLIKKYPTILACDSTLTDTFRIRRKASPGIISYIIFSLKNIITMPLLKVMAKRIAFFITFTTWCKKSLINDFKIKEENIIVAPGGFDLNLWKTDKKKSTINVIPYLLFVGNDFERKGGDFLLSLYTKYIFPKAKLKIVSNDPYLKGFKAPKGVELIQGITEFKDVIYHYQTADLFVFPTRVEQMGHVLVEASIAGLPLIATDIGGVSEVVRNGVNGYLMPYNASEKEWADKILSILFNEKKYNEFKKAGLDLAKKHFSKEIFVKRLDTAFKRVGLTY